MNNKLSTSHRRRISFDPKFLAQASPSQVQSFKASLIEGRIEQASIMFDVSDFQDSWAQAS